MPYKVVVIGSGIAGTAAALTTAKLGAKTAIIEDSAWGGAALNNCEIPFYSLLDLSHTLTKARRLSETGLFSGAFQIDPTAVDSWRRQIIQRSSGNDPKKFTDLKIDCLHGSAKFVSPNIVSVDGKQISANKFILAPGSSINFATISGASPKNCITAKTALSDSVIPQTIAIVGGGSTGCEFAQYYAEMGAKVILIESESRILPREDTEASNLMSLYLAKRSGVRILTNTRAIKISSADGLRQLHLAQGDQEMLLATEAIFLATGETPNLAPLNLDAARVKTKNNAIKTDKTLLTSNRHIWAAGDALGRFSSISSANYEGSIAGNNAVRHAKNIINYSGFTRLTNTTPQIAKVGYNELECKAGHRRIKTSVALINQLHAANIQNFHIGFVKLVSDRSKQRRILGATVMAPNADTIIQEAAIAVRHNLSALEIASTPHVATSWSEAMRLAAKRLVR